MFRKIFSFESKFGWSELFSLIALGIAIFALILNNKLEIDDCDFSIAISQKEPFYDSTSNDIYQIIYVAISIKNNSKKPLTVKGLDLYDNIPLISPIIDGKSNLEIIIPYSTTYIRDGHNKYDEIKDDIKYIKKHRSRILPYPKSLMKTINPKNTEYFDFYVVLNPYDSNGHKYSSHYVFNSSLVFMNNEKKQISSVFELYSGAGI